MKNLNSSRLMALGFGLLMTASLQAVGKEFKSVQIQKFSTNMTAMQQKQTGKFQIRKTQRQFRNFAPKMINVPQFRGVGYRLPPRIIDVPQFSGAGYRLQPRVIDVTAFTGSGYRLQPRIIDVPPFSGAGYRLQPRVIDVPRFTGQGYRNP